MIELWKWLPYRSRRSTPDNVSRVFATGGVPSVTFVARKQLGLEQRMAESLRRRHAFTVVSGPTKCGKSVICHYALGGAPSITIQGGQIESADNFWQHVAHKLRLPGTHTHTQTRGWSLRTLSEAAFGTPAIAQTKVSADNAKNQSHSDAVTYASLPILDAVALMRARDITLVIEDFHYIEKAAQTAIVRALKSAVFEGLRVVILAVPHRAFDPTDVENEVEGRVNHIEVPRWSVDDLAEIAELGFAELHLSIPPTLRRRICDDAFGSPLLMQEICYELSVLRLSTSANAEPTNISDLSRSYDQILDRKGLRRFDRFAQCTIGGTTPPVVELRKGGAEAVTMVLLAAVARLGPKPITGYEELREAFATLTRAGPLSPDRVGALCASMASVVSTGRSVPLEWLPGTQEIALTDPFLMFYMRWMLRDRRSITLHPSAIETALSFHAGKAPADEDPRP